jgi:cytochrome P450 family 4
MNLILTVVLCLVDDEPMSNFDISEEIDTILFAGHESASKTISFCLYNIAKYSNVQEKVFEELKSVFGDNFENPISLKSLNDLKYLEWVIMETLRLYPPVTFYGRRAEKNLEISKKYF